MSSNRVLLVINDVQVSSSLIRPFKIGRPKLWADDTGRDMDGNFDGTLIGIFPKLAAILHPRNNTELSSLCIELDKPSQQIQYFNPITNQLVNLGTYSGDYEITIEDASGTDNIYGDINISLISRSKE